MTNNIQPSILPGGPRAARYLSFNTKPGVDPAAVREAILALGGKRDVPVDIYELFMRMADNNAGADQRQSLVDRVRLLKQEGYGTGIVTNNVKEFGDGWRALIPVEELFDFVVDSSHAGVRKPDPRIFECALQALATALRRLGEDAAAREALDRFREVAGLERELARLEDRLLVSPNDHAAALERIGLLLRLGRREEAARRFAELEARAPALPGLDAVERELADAS